jgi:hypothetical protein
MLNRLLMNMVSFLRWETEDRSFRPSIATLAKVKTTGAPKDVLADRDNCS